MWWLPSFSIYVPSLTPIVFNVIGCSVTIIISMYVIFNSNNVKDVVVAITFFMCVIFKSNTLKLGVSKRVEPDGPACQLEKKMVGRVMFISMLQPDLPGLPTRRDKTRASPHQPISPLCWFFLSLFLHPFQWAQREGMRPQDTSHC